MRYASSDPLSDMIVDRRHEVGLSGRITNAARSLGRVLCNGGPLANLRKAPPSDEPGNGPLPLPTSKSSERWQSLEDMYQNENFFGFEATETAALNQMQQLRRLAIERGPSPGA